MLSDTQDETRAFDAQFSRCRGLLYFIASRVLDGGEGADEAVKNCFLTAICNPREFESEGSFRSWLLRILIDEALQILRQKKGASPRRALQELTETASVDCARSGDHQAAMFIKELCYPTQRAAESRCRSVFCKQSARSITKVRRFALTF